MKNLDEYFIAPMFGYRDRFQYYEECNVVGKLHRVKVPCFFLHAKDDIVINPESVPFKEIEKS